MENWEIMTVFLRLKTCDIEGFYTSDPQTLFICCYLLLCPLYIIMDMFTTGTFNIHKQASPKVMQILMINIDPKLYHNKCYV